MRVVLLHALPLTAAMWSQQLDWLPASTFAPTLYDYGDSIEDWAGEALNGAGTADLVVVGSSVGGFCALEMARRAPERVRAVVLVGSKAGVRRDRRARDHALAVLSTYGFEAAWAEFWQPIWGPNAPPALIEHAKGMAAAVGVERLRRGVRAFFDRPDLSQFARAWPRPIHLISGEYDSTPSSATSEQVAADAVNGRFRLIADCGHYVNLELPALFDEVLRDCLGDAG